MSTEDPLIGYNLGGRFLVERHLETEWLGKVYAARTRRGELVRIKVLDPALTDDHETLERFGREMLATASVEHAHTVRMIDFGEHSVFHYLVFEYLVADTLREALQRDGTFSPERVVRVAAQICEALTAAHAQSIVHRNLTPDAVLLLRNVAHGDYVKVKDFGLAKLRDDHLDAGGLTAVGTRVGNPRYMAPEYIEDGHVDPRGDLYALGCMMYEMLVGTSPFDSPSVAQVLDAQVEQPAPRVSRSVKVPRWLDDFVDRLLAKDPRGRFGNADLALQALEDGIGVALRPPDLLPFNTQGAVPERMVAPPVAKPSGKAGKAVTVAVAAGLGVVVAVVVVSLLVAGLVVVFGT